mgnify:CR=1 FL=1
MKNKIFAIGGAILAVVLVLIMIITMLPSKPTSEPNDDPVSSTVSTTTVNLEDIKDPDTDTSSTTDGNFIEPNESEADKILEENKTPSKNTTSTTSEPKKTETNKTESNKTTTSEDKPQSFEDSKKELENTASDYLKKHNINPKTAGETGEKCVHCGSKLWDPDKYGLNIPGMPEDYDNSGYCLGTCAISLE